MAIRIAILTISDLCSQGKRADISGQTIEDMLPDDKFEVCEKKIVPDDYETITEVLRQFSDEQKVEIVITTGGTGLGPRDVTPEATDAGRGTEAHPERHALSRRLGYAGQHSDNQSSRQPEGRP